MDYLSILLIVNYMKKRVIIGTIVIMILSVLYHNIYKWIPNTIIGLLFPVNESIWEHGKMIIMSFISWLLIEKYLFRDETNIIVSNFLSCVICITLDFLIFTPIYLYVLNTNDNMVVTLGVYLFSIIVSLAVRELFIRDEKDIRKEMLSIVGFLVFIIFFAVLTYYPLELPIFYDYNKKIYGIPLK